MAKQTPIQGLAADFAAGKLQDETWSWLEEHIVVDNGIPEKAIKPNDNLMTYIMRKLDEAGVLEDITIEDGRLGTAPGVDGKIYGSNYRIYGSAESIAKFCEAAQERLTIVKADAPKPNLPGIRPTELH